MTGAARFDVGELVQHRLFDYRGVIFDVDPVFLGSEDWYREVALSRPPRDRPWYHVLVDGTAMRTYVAERNLEHAGDRAPVSHPEVENRLGGFDGERYLPQRRSN